MSQLTVHEDRIGPVRGIVLAHSSKGHALKAADLERWIRLDRAVFKTSKVDVLMNVLDFEILRTLAEACGAMDVRLSLRTDCSCPPPRSEALQALRLLDVFLCPATPEAEVVRWMDACTDAGLSMRMQIPLDLLGSGVPEWIEENVTSGRVTAINLSAWDAFSASGRMGERDPRSLMERVNALAKKLAARDLEVNVVGLPFCWMDADNRALVVNSRQFHLDHAQYQREAYEFARKLFGCGPLRIRQLILMLLGIHTSTDNPIDRILLPWIWQTPWVRARVWAAHKVLRHLGWSTWEQAQVDVEESRQARSSKKTDACASCSLRLVCDGIPESVPGLGPKPYEGEVAVDPLLHSARQPKFYDEVDEARLTQTRRWAALAEEANATIRNRPPDREIDSFSYTVEGNWSFAAPGSLRWYSFTRAEKVSTPLARLDPPFTLSVTVGSGIAEYAGFAFGKALRVMCPMTAYTHRIVLHVEADGQYVLLRDGRPIRPVEFAGTLYVPVRLGTALEPRICVRNVDGTIATQAVQLWQGRAEAPASRAAKSISVVIVCTRYARRLQACLLGIAHQRGIAMSQVEVLISHVPGLDATGDVIDSIRSGHPELDIVPLTFVEALGNAKGLMLNEAFDKARGNWVMVLDADVILHPEMLARIAALPSECTFAVPDGRKMLDREATSRVLLGEAAPWNQWDELLEGAGEYRRREVDGVPIGYCQCVRRECLETVRYEEANHFEGADWRFGKDMRDAFGEETRLSGMPVLHLDHGSSNWYGASRHF